MKRKTKRTGSTNAAVDSTIILGDLTEVNQITRDGSTVTLHGRENPRSFQLPNEEAAAMFWQALAAEAAEAVQEDRQFFCVSFDSFGCGAATAGEGSLH